MENPPRRHITARETQQRYQWIRNLPGFTEADTREWQKRLDEEEASNNIARSRNVHTVQQNMPTGRVHPDRRSQIKTAAVVGLAVLVFIAVLAFDQANRANLSTESMTDSDGNRTPHQTQTAYEQPSVVKDQPGWRSTNGNASYTTVPQGRWNSGAANEQVDDELDAILDECDNRCYAPIQGVCSRGDIPVFILPMGNLEYGSVVLDYQLRGANLCYEAFGALPYGAKARAGDPSCDFGLRTDCIGPDGGWCEGAGCYPVESTDAFACYADTLECGSVADWRQEWEMCQEQAGCDPASLEQCYGMAYCLPTPSIPDAPVLEPIPGQQDCGNVWSTTDKIDMRDFGPNRDDGC
jgi:hypothetical protein